MTSQHFDTDENARSAALYEAQELTGSTDETTLIRIAHYILSGEHEALGAEARVLNGGGVSDTPADQVLRYDGGGVGSKLAAAFTGRTGVNIPTTVPPPVPEEEIQRYADDIATALRSQTPVDNTVADGNCSDEELERLRAQMHDQPIVLPDEQAQEREASFRRQRDANERWRTGHAYDENPTEDGQA